MPHSCLPRLWRNSQTVVLEDKLCPWRQTGVAKLWSLKTYYGRFKHNFNLYISLTVSYCKMKTFICFGWFLPVWLTVILHSMIVASETIFNSTMVSIEDETVVPASVYVYMFWLKAVGILIISRILSPARPLGLKQNVYCVKNMSGWHSAIVTLIIWQPSLLKFPKLECSCQNDALHCTCIYGSLYRCGEMVAHAFSLNTGWTLGLRAEDP